MSTNKRDELLRVATEILKADYTVHRTREARSVTIEFFKKKEILNDIIDLASNLIDAVDERFDYEETPLVSCS